MPQHMLEAARYGLTDDDRRAMRWGLSRLRSMGRGTAPRHKRRRGVGTGGGSSDVKLGMGILTGSIAAGASGGGSLFEGDVPVTGWKNSSGVSYPSGLTVGLVHFVGSGETYIWPAFCPVPEE